ncbi:MAG: hypothetical protein RLY93_01080 [Sumerlaeia bacterium]
MWPPPNPLPTTHLLTDTPAREVLSQVGTVKTYVLTDRFGLLHLAHWLDEDGEKVRYLLSPTTEELLAQLKRGEISMFEALRQPHCFLLDEYDSGERALYRCAFTEIPAEYLPK